VGFVLLLCLSAFDRTNKILSWLSSFRVLIFVLWILKDIRLDHMWGYRQVTLVLEADHHAGVT